MSMHVILITLHVAFAAVMFGLPLGLVGTCRRAMEQSPEAFRLAAAEASRKGMIITIATLLTLFTGVALIMSLGGFGAITPNFHAALGLMILHIVISVATVKPAAEKLVQAAAGESIDTELGNKGLKLMAMGSGMLQLNWIVMLLLMNMHF